MFNTNFCYDLCDQILLQTTKINSISWADDLVLMSHSQKVLQNGFDKLSTYCNGILE